MTQVFGDFPDAELMATTILAAAKAGGQLGGFTACEIGTRIADNADFTHGVIVVTRAGGLAAERIRIDRPRIQVDVWHADKQSARDLADVARRRLFEAEGDMITTTGSVDVGFLSGVDSDTPLSWAFDPISLKPRYMFSVRFTTHQADG
jgi:hypothetical protein